MSVFLQPIYTQTVGSAVASVTFNNIPQTFTDLAVLISARSGRPEGPDDIVAAYFNNTQTNYSDTRLYGLTTSGIGSDRLAKLANNSPGSRLFAGISATNNATSSTFGNSWFYIPNYTGSNFKSTISDGVSENNATFAVQMLAAGLWSNTSAITSVTFDSYYLHNWQQYSTFTLYGITKG